MTRSFAPLLVVAAAFVFGAAVVLGFGRLTGDLVRVLVAVAVAAAGAGVAVLPGAGVVTRHAGAGLVAFGAALVGSTASGDPVRYGLPALVLLVLAATGPRIWVSGAGVLIALALPGSVWLAAVAALLVVVAGARTWWGDLAGAAAGAFLLGQTSATAAAVAAVLLMAAAVRRDLVTGLLAAAVLTTTGHVWPLVVVVVVAGVAIRVPGIRAAVTRLPALRGTRPAYATATAAVVAAGGLVGIALQAQLGWLVLVTVLIAGALGHWLPAPAGPALAVVAIAGLGVANPYPVLDLVVALGVVPLLRRHPLPGVFAAAAFLVVRIVPLDPLVVVLVVGAVAAVLAFGRRTAPAGQAVGTVVLGVVAFQPVRPEAVVLVLVMALAVSTGWRPSAPLAVAAVFAGYVTLAPVTTGLAVAGALAVAAAALAIAALASRRRFARR